MKKNIIIILALLINFSVTSVYALENDNIELYNSTDISTESDNQTDIDKNSINQNTSDMNINIIADFESSSSDINNNQINESSNINTSTGNEKIGWVKEDGNIYYYVNNNKVKGFQTIEGKTYFFSNVNYALKSDMQCIDGKLFYLNNDGTVVHGWKEIDGKKYYFGEDHFAVKGFQTIEGNTYFFSNIDYSLKRGWQSINGNIFYLNNNGIMVYGSQTIENRNYLFGNDGYLQGFKYVNNQMYYYNPDGTQAKGIQRLAGCYYKFNEITGAFEKFVNQKIVIDVSVHQGDIDWNAVKNSGKIDAVILRIGYGVRWMDSKFLRNVNELNRLGIPYSVYLFSYAENDYEAELEADNLINIVKNNPVYIASNLFSIYYDLESWYISSTGENSNGISKETYGNMITTFINKVTSSLGIKTRIYASKNYIETRFPESVRPYMGWIAQWSNNFTYTGTYEGWQYTDCASVPGINGPVDMSIFYY